MATGSSCWGLADVPEACIVLSPWPAYQADGQASSIVASNALPTGNCYSAWKWAGRLLPFWFPLLAGTKRCPGCTGGWLAAGRAACTAGTARRLTGPLAHTGAGAVPGGRPGGGGGGGGAGAGRRHRTGRAGGPPAGCCPGASTGPCPAKITNPPFSRSVPGLFDQRP